MDENRVNLEQLEEQIEKSQKLFTTLLDSIDAVVYVTDIKTNEILYVNKYTENIFGNIAGKICWQTLQIDQKGPCNFCTNHKLLTPEGKPTGLYHWEFQNTVNGKWYDIRDRAIEWIDGRIARLEIAVDITEHKKAEDMLKASLKEKEVLLQEIHHRVKNNMTVIASLLKLQAERVNDEHYREMFSDSIARIKTMALIHEKLYRSEDLSQIDFSEYINQIIDNIYMSYGMGLHKVTLKKDIENVFIGIDTAITCGLIVNELVTNSFKHAFPQSVDGVIKVAFRRNDKDVFELSISDNGNGIPKGLDYRNPDSLGLQLVNTLTRQLNGKIEQLGKKGIEYKITFKCSAV